jgi:tetratricopeptide (TPR) repeat protein
MDVMKTNNQQDEIIQFFYQKASDESVGYRLSFAQEAMNDHEALEAELSNIWAVVHQSYQQKAWKQVSAFRDALQSFLDLRGYWVQSIMLNEWAYEAALANGDRFNTARWTHDRADILHQQGRYHEAEKLYQTSEAAYRALGENEMALKSRHMRSLVLRACGRLTEAQQLCETTINEAQKLELGTWLAHPLYVLALLVRDTRDLRRAQQLMEKSFLLLIDTDELAMIGQCCHFLGEVAFLQKDLTKARVLVEKSLQLSQQVGIMRRIAATQRLLGDLERAEGHYEEAAKIYDEGSAIASRLGDQPVLARLLLSKAKLMIQLKRTPEAIRVLKGAFSIYRETGDVRGVGASSLLLMQLYLHQGHFWLLLQVGFVAFRTVLSTTMLHPHILFNISRLRT